MGLDSYLYKKTYIGNHYKKPEEQTKIDVAGVKQERVSYITEQVGCWRKANHIHNWFVNNVQEGDDNCQEYPVDLEQLKELLTIVNEILEYPFDDNKKAKELLPTAEGFFFGGTEYDSYYYDDLRDTKRILEEVLAEDGGDYYYQASW